ncbi:hypothetical protein CEQ90_06765 [Lewinellaceae bacterium SD302]|nr:hypothetical protein CEQ90_06765 [Lewinellaceae bacterium SD302]
MLEKQADLSADLQLLQNIRDGRHELLDTLYRDHRDAFLSYARQHLYANEEDAADCFQDAVIVFYKNAVSGKLTELTSTIRTYLFAIGKRMVYRKNQQRRREAPVDLDLERSPADEIDLSIFTRIDDDHRKQFLAAAMNRMGDTCRQILTLFYYHRYPIESIQTTLNLSSPGAVRVKKLRCLESLKKMLSKPQG